jgi:hypothetical protein
MASHQFRAIKDETTLLYSKEVYDLSMFFALIDVQTLMLYTGRDDIHGTPIYEGDYVGEYKKSTGKLGDIVYKIEWDAKQMGFYFKYYLDYAPNPPMPTFDYPSRFKNVKVMGNVYSTPELKPIWMRSVPPSTQQSLPTP